MAYAKHGVVLGLATAVTSRRPSISHHTLYPGLGPMAVTICNPNPSSGASQPQFVVCLLGFSCLTHLAATSRGLHGKAKGLKLLQASSIMELRSFEREEGRFALSSLGLSEGRQAEAWWAPLCSACAEDPFCGPTPHTRRAATGLAVASPSNRMTEPEKRRGSCFVFVVLCPAWARKPLHAACSCIAAETSSMFLERIFGFGPKTTEGFAAC